MDSILVVGQQDTKLQALLTRLGYEVRGHEDGTQLSSLIATSVIDLIVLDGRLEGMGPELCEFLRTQDATKTVPIVFIAETDDQTKELTDAGLDRVEVVEPPLSVGRLASRIATNLRLRKFAGEDELKASLAEANTRLRDLNQHFKKELDDARKIQESLLPAMLPADKRFDLAVSYQPLEEVGGDWYFVEKYPNGSIAAHIADVTGHGLSAAFIGSMTKLALSAVGSKEPHELLEGVNRLMAPQLPEGRFVTMGSFVYDPDTAKIIFSRAGHPPMLVVNPITKKIVQLTGEGFAIGFFPDATYTFVEHTLEVGDMVLLYTDGVTEAQNRSRQTYGTDRLAEVLLKCGAEMATSGILEQVIDDFDKFREERIIQDDVTMILMRRTG